MASLRNPVRDRVAVVGVGTTRYTRAAEGVTPQALAVEAAMNAVRDAGLAREDIDGLCIAGALGRTANVQYLQEGLGVPQLRWWANLAVGSIASFSFIESVNAVFSGACTTALVVHSSTRTAFNSASVARGDPFRAREAAQGGPRVMTPLGQSQYYAPYRNATSGYAGFMNRYMVEYGATREQFGRLAINMRANAMRNEHAIMRKPLGMDEYLASRYIREPMCMLDMDIPVDGADAFVVTTVERARDLAKKPVLVHAETQGQAEHPEDDQAISLRRHGQQIVCETLWSKSELGLGDVDLLFLYDGYSVLTMNWLENLGYCKPGEGGPFVESNWNKAEDRIMIDGRIPVNTHGGSLSEGATQGAGHLREAVVQLRGEAGTRQVAGCKVALAALGGFFFNSTALVLRVD
jgi:acetyl-CoA acetyltransferase